MRVGQKGDAVSIQFVWKVIDEDLIARHFDVVDVVMRTQLAEEREGHMRLPQSDDVGRQFSDASERRLTERQNADAIEDPISSDRGGNDQPSGANSRQQWRLGRPI